MEDKIQTMLEAMSLREKIGQLIQIDFRHWKGQAFTEMNQEVAQIIADYHLGGIILFRENLAESEQIFDLLWNMQKARLSATGQAIPLFTTIDQEGGIVTRIQDGTNMPGNMALGAIDDADLTEEVAYAMGQELNALGFNINFAPTIDVNSNPENPVIGIRSFSSDADRVAKHGLAYMRGMKKAGVGATAKHFPGHGDTAVDSHFDLPQVDRDRKTLQEVDLKPFQALMDEKLDMVMTAHIVVPALDNGILEDEDGHEMGTPATLSYPILTELMREKMAYEGVIITDAMNMEAISRHFSFEKSTVMALEAGADIVLMPVFIREEKDVQKLEKLYQAIESALENPESRFTEERLNDSVRRILKLKAQRGILEWNDESYEKKKAKALQIVGSDKHRQLEKEVAEKAVTIIRDENILPILPQEEDRILLLSADEDRLLLMKHVLKEYSQIDYKLYDAEDTEIPSLEAYQYVICETYNLSEKDSFPPKLLQESHRLGIPFIHMASRNPYDVRYLNASDVSIAVYGSLGFDQTQGGQSALPANIPAGLRVLFGLARAQGNLPVEIKDKDNQKILYPLSHSQNSMI